MKTDMTAILPEVCLSHILSFTSPRDACRSSLVSPIFRSAANSDTVWERFLPSDYQDIISNASLPAETFSSLSKKELYFHLCNNPIIIDNGTMCFTLDKRSGKKCYMMGARGLSITWGDQPKHWSWTCRPESRFPEVIELMSVSMIGFKGNIETKILSPETTYVAYLVFKFAEYRFGFKQCHVNFYVKYKKEEAKTRRVFLDPPAGMPQLCRERGDGWMEIEMGEFYNEKEEDDDGIVKYSVWEIDNWYIKLGLIIEGIELRPKQCL
ncbi:putative F-box protein PP2-B12 [Durio zibethinus]|uniref:F-box protein PP2-B12 n=1 Tax=Durio zibethinus TaxID=66656 RepID=A0A6P5Y1T1_DURZI|nr:putative F-box protein PP2-B12 [Durio zibethinus]